MQCYSRCMCSSLRLDIGMVIRRLKVEERLGEAYDTLTTDIPEPSCVGEARTWQEPFDEGMSSVGPKVVVVSDPPVDIDVQPVPTPPAS